MKTHCKPMRDHRLELADSYCLPEDITFRPPVEALIERYAPHVARLANQKSTTVRLTKVRGGQTVVRNLILSSVVRDRLNRALPRIRSLSKRSGRFTALQFCNLLNVKPAAGNKYLNILLATELLKSDEKVWGASYSWSGTAKNSYL